MNLKSTITMALAVFGFGALAAWQGAEAARGSKPPVLPEQAAAAIETEFPDAEIAEVERERVGVVLYEVEFERDGEEVEVTVTAEGQIVAIEREMDEDDLPETVVTTLAEHAGEAEIEEVEAEEVRAELKFVPVAKPRVVYEVEFHNDGREVELTIDANGKLLGKGVEHEDDDVDDVEHEDDDIDDVEHEEDDDDEDHDDEDDD
ncbi:MAG: PepSY domain-containing protein [Planctomycetota bacterium]|jgi:hypothetical protein